MDPNAIFCVVPSVIGVNETFTMKVKLLGPPRAISVKAQWNTRKPVLHGPFNLNVERQIQYHDDCLPEWTGRLAVEGAAAMSGPAELVFDGRQQGVFPRDTRPIRVFSGFKIGTPGIHFIRLVDRASGVEGWANPILVCKTAPARRLFWGDPHWQTFFSDGIRCPEELYSFARDEAFLDFGAITDHMEAVTDRQWQYFQDVTNDFNAPGRFATLIGQEWTNHNPKVGAPGHRNVYYRGRGGPVLRSNSADCDTLPKLWRQLDTMPAGKVLAIPHHSANVSMGVDWEQGWNPKYEKAVEIHSIWGSSECHADNGNPLPILSLGGEMRGRHVVDALKKGFRFGFIGGGDIHDGRPGLPLQNLSCLKRLGGSQFSRSCGYTAVSASRLTRATVFDAIRDHHTYATTQSRIYLDVARHGAGKKNKLTVTAASEEGIREAAVIFNGEIRLRLPSGADGRIVAADDVPLPLAPDDFCYVRITTGKNNLAWSSPLYGAPGCDGILCSHGKRKPV